MCMGGGGKVGECTCQHSLVHTFVKIIIIDYLRCPIS